MRVLLLCILFTLSFAECPQGCADAIAHADNQASVCGENEDPLPSPCTEMDGLECLQDVIDACMGDLSGGECPQGCKDAIELPANQASVCGENEDPLPSPCTAMDAANCFMEVALACAGSGEDACPQGCADAIAHADNHESVCGDNNDDLPSPCTASDGLSCLMEVAVACASDGGEGTCSGVQNMAVYGALQAATTTECQTLVAVMDADDGPDETDAQICACFASGPDFSAYSSYNCKVSSDDSQDVSAYVSGTGVCAAGSGDAGDAADTTEAADTTAEPAGDDSSSSTLSLFFAFAALFFGLA